MDGVDLKQALAHIDPASLDYQDWVSVGMALKHEGYSARDWDEWSRMDFKRYHSGDCEKKWAGFSGSSGALVTGGTIVKMAMDAGWRPASDDSGHSMDWEDTIGGKDDMVVVDTSWLEGREVTAPRKWNPAEQLSRYLELLFDSTETVGFVTKTWEKDGKYLPTKGVYNKTAGKLIEELSKCDGDLGKVIGDYNPQAGAWIRFNPLDGNGVKNENVSEFRFALVESDSMEIEKQNAIIRELEIPVACLVHSGKKSLHAIVRVEAANYEEYRKRVDFLYSVLKKNGMEVDTQNKNPSRLSRMPGIMRDGKKQYVVDTNIGKANWDEWREWIDGINDDLPDIESTSLHDMDNLPQLAPELISGVLRQGDKMLIAGPSKAGKSFLLLELCVAIAEGLPWLGWQCAKGKVLYVNLELQRSSCLHRIHDVYQAMGVEPRSVDNIDRWELRGKSVPMDKLAPKLIRRAAKKHYMAIVIDPIYKVITGDENSASEMAKFCNQFDRVCNELGCAVIYCHHHSKGAQGGKKSMDRASGSGVFARDPDAMLDVSELNIDEDIQRQRENNMVAAVLLDWLKEHIDNWQEATSQDDRCSASQMLAICKNAAGDRYLADVQRLAFDARQRARHLTAWRIDGTLREFPKFAPKNFWFDYPVHSEDESGTLADADTDSGYEKSRTWRKNFPKKRPPQEREKEKKDALETAYDACNIDGKVTVSDIATYMGVTEKTVRSHIKKHDSFSVKDGDVKRK